METIKLVRKHENAPVEPKTFTLEPKEKKAVEPMTFKIERTADGEIEDVTFYPDLIPHDGEIGLVIFSDDAAQKTKLMIRRVYWRNETLILSPGVNSQKDAFTEYVNSPYDELADFDEFTDYDEFTGDERKNVAICGLILRPGQKLSEKSHINKSFIINTNAEIERITEELKAAIKETEAAIKETEAAAESEGSDNAEI